MKRNELDFIDYLLICAIVSVCLIACMIFTGAFMLVRGSLNGCFEGNTMDGVPYRNDAQRLNLYGK